MSFETSLFAGDGSTFEELIEALMAVQERNGAAPLGEQLNLFSPGEPEERSESNGRGKRQDR
jgi:hypothetical protein